MNTSHGVLYYDDKEGDFLHYCYLVWIDREGLHKKALPDYPSYITSNLNG